MEEGETGLRRSLLQRLPSVRIEGLTSAAILPEITGGVGTVGTESGTMNDEE